LSVIRDHTASSNDDDDDDGKDVGEEIMALFRALSTDIPSGTH
jgi:hypothetical protein